MGGKCSKIVIERSNSLSGRAFFIATNLISCLYPKSQGEKASVLGEFDRSQCTGNYRPETLCFQGKAKAASVCTTHRFLTTANGRRPSTMANSTIPQAAPIAQTSPINPTELPAIICFTSSQGVEFGFPVEWINKGWSVRTKRDWCFVMPVQVEWACMMPAERNTAGGGGTNITEVQGCKPKE